MEIKKVAVIGGGTMGNGITHVFAMNGYDVNLVEMKVELFDRAIGMISKNLDRQIKKEIITQSDKEAALSRISKVVGVKNVPVDTDLVIEAIFENKEVKLSVFKELDAIIKPDSMFASNTS